MPLQNRVTPAGELVAVAARGLVYGNRGCLHDADRTVRRPFAVRRWISCRLEFRGRHRADPMPPGQYTGLFFLDEATALAAGHRPCAECRREDYRRFTARWAEWGPEDRGADAIDRRLHTERWADGRPRRHRAAYDDLPDASFVLLDGQPWLVDGESLRRWTPVGYTAARPRPDGAATVLTPPSLRRLLATGWTTDLPLLHPTARDPATDGSDGTG